MKRALYLLTFFLAAYLSYSQKVDYSVSEIPDSLQQNANAVIRLEEKGVTIVSQRKMKIYTKRVVTVLNERGQGAVNAYEHYDKSTAINTLEITVFNESGKEIKKVKKGEFRDQSATDEGTVFSDNRILYFNYTPTGYPYTVVFQSETTTSNTAFIPSWRPIRSPYVSVQKSILSISYPQNLGFKKKEQLLSQYRIEKTIETTNQLSYNASNIPALKPEAESPSLSKLIPIVKLGLESFHLEGVDGSAKSWKEFGEWYGDKIISGTTDVSDDTKAKIRTLVGSETDPIKKAKIIYKYVQEKSRYVSIQVGIGGWKPMYAKDVDRLGYGDCKALSNYTRALLNIVDVPSYNTILYRDDDKVSIDPDFVSMQGNHMILAIPDGGNYIWLECTSQDGPFGAQDGSTDDREVLVVKPDGGQIVRTYGFTDTENSQISHGNYSVMADGTLNGKIVIVSKGTQYAHKSRLETRQPKDKENFYKEYWGNLNNLKISKLSMSNDKEKIAFTEDAEINASGYGMVNGNTMMFPVNAFNQSRHVPQRYRTRNNPLEIERGYFDQDEIEIILPENYAIDAKPDNFEIKEKFGHYKTELIAISANKLTYKRSLLMNKGIYEKSDYENYRKFKEQIAKADNAKIVLTKKT